TIRICGDYKVTTNRVASLNKYPLPRIEDLFASLSGGQTFSKLDVSHAYQQVELEEDSRQSEEEHLACLSEVLRRLAESGMRLKKEKCSFLLSSVEYLGHVISSKGLCTSDTKVAAISNAPSFTNVSELRSFLGMVNYYGKFLPDLATVLLPLYSLLQKNKGWSWEEPQETAFHSIKELLKLSRVLVHFDPEALAIIFGVKKYHQFFYGRQFTLKMDHKPLIHIFSEKKATPVLASGRIQRWALALGAYSYTIQYREGKKNVCADAMSRLPLKSTFTLTPKPQELIHLMEYLDTSPTTSLQIKQWTDCDPELSKVCDWILSAWPEKEVTDEGYVPYWRRRYELNVEEGCVLWGNRVVIPKRGRETVIKMLHEGYTGIVRMKSFARSYVWWPGIDAELEQCVKSCVSCQIQRKSPPVVPLHPWAWPERAWSRVHIDYAGPFEGKSFLVMIDAYSKWKEVCITNPTMTAATIELMRNLLLPWDCLM
uniref:Integrase zinc-binding domain-containing protein n=1 Tax=Amphimedon queenslandica TaxID=400682 RepID=A0A1X7T330_AMPQE